jgi:predicted anti-sigma-YlaC factor YlaD
MISFHGWESPIIFWSAIVAIVIITNYFSHKNLASRHRMMETLAEKGQPIPPELLARGREYYHYRDRSPIQSGIFLMCIGIALAVFFWAMGGGGNLVDGDHVPNWLPVIGIFPFMVGLARFLGGFFDRPRDK